MEGRTRAQARALNQQQAAELLSTLGPIAGSQIINSLAAGQGTLKKHSELPLGPVQDPEPKPTAFAEACAFAYANVWEGAMPFEFQGLLATGTFTLLLGGVSEGII